MSFEKIFRKYSVNSKVIGIGTGRTMEKFSKILPNDKTYVPTSLQTILFLKDKNTKPCENVENVDVYFDGADYYNNDGYLIKGNGGAILLERLLCSMATKTIIIVQKEKYKKKFYGITVPVVIVKESYSFFMSYLKKIGAKGSIRTVNGSTPYITDQYNIIVDVEYFDEFAEKIPILTGFITHGLIAPQQNIIIEEIEEEL